MTTRSADAASPPIESDEVHCRRLLEDAAEMIAQGDRRQASEKLWGAAARRIEALAAARGWPCQSKADGQVIISHVANHVGNRQVDILFSAAACAEQNIYDDDWEDEEFAAVLGEIRDLIDLLDAAERELPADLEPPTAKYYRQWHGLAPAATERG